PSWIETASMRSSSPAEGHSRGGLDWVRGNGFRCRRRIGVSGQDPSLTSGTAFASPAARADRGPTGSRRNVPAGQAQIDRNQCDADLLAVKGRGYLEDAPMTYRTILGQLDLDLPAERMLTFGFGLARKFEAGLIACAA